VLSVIQLTRRDIIAHQASVPWPDQRQVEQDLLLSLAMAALFSDEFLKSQIAMRGGTLLHKVHLAPASRYSEDIDLVVFGDRTEEHIKKAIQRVLAGILGRPSKSIWESVKLSVRNVIRPSRVLRIIYNVPSQVDPRGKPMDIVVETNVTERIPHREITKMEFAYSFRDAAATTIVNGFDIHEMLGTKMRAMFQRKRGRDLFDLYWALTNAPIPVAPAYIIESFLHYMNQEGATAGRDEFIGILRDHLRDRGFLSDMNSLLRQGVEYDPIIAGDYVIDNLLSLLPDDVKNTEEAAREGKPKRARF
jgi:predicted nucleotidyltransferase component of viral defense system